MICKQCGEEFEKLYHDNRFCEDCCYDSLQEYRSLINKVRPLKEKHKIEIKPRKFKKRFNNILFGRNEIK